MSELFTKTLYQLGWEWARRDAHGLPDDYDGLLRTQHLKAAYGHLPAFQKGVESWYQRGKAIDPYKRWSGVRVRTDPRANFNASRWFTRRVEGRDAENRSTPLY